MKPTCTRSLAGAAARAVDDAARPSPAAASCTKALLLVLDANSLMLLSGYVTSAAEASPAWSRKVSGVSVEPVERPPRPPALLTLRETGRHFEVAALIETEVIHLHAAAGPRIAHPYAQR